MKKIYLVRLLVLTGFFILGSFTPSLGQTSLSGTINTYRSVTDITGKGNLELNSTAGLSSGDKVLIIQMKGAEIVTEQTDTFGSVFNYAGAGSHEWGIICDIVGTTVILEKELLHRYSVDGAVQLIPIPQYTDATVDNTLTAQNWNGTTGGVLVFEVSGTLTLNATIELTNRGFRGGQHEESTFSCTFLDAISEYGYTLASGFGAQKGEGIANYETAHEAGRGPLANGGGGGNDHNSGGGGGANQTRGGQGGENQDPSFFTCKGLFPGLGGKGVSIANDRLFMGGGGGAGHSNSQFNSSGGDGGGLILIKAGTLVGNGQSIRSDGNPGQNGFGDGSGGGGAGGTIVLDVNNYSGNVNVEARGGEGGSSDNFTAQRCFGPGGGGAGGLAYYNSATTPAQITTFLDGGANGIVTNSLNTNCAGEPLGATSGSAGTEAFDYVMPTGVKGNQDCSYVPTINLPDSINACTGQTIVLDAENPGTTINWSTSETTQTISVTENGTFWVSVDDGTFTVCDTVVVEFNPSVSANLGGDRLECIGETVTLTAGPAGLTYMWSTGESSNSIEVTADGTYSVFVDNNGCSATDTVEIQFVPPPTPITNEVILCEAPSVELNAQNPLASYSWSTGETSQTIEVADAGIYSVVIAISSSCAITEEVEVTLCLDGIDVPNTITPNGDGKNDVWKLGNLGSFPDHNVQLFNRNGDLIFNSTNYQNDWDGGNYPDGTYYYIIELGGDSPPVSGTLTVIKG